MRYRERRYRWEWRLRSSPERLWPLVADTNRFNRDTGLPAVRRLEQESPPHARQRLTLSRFGLRLDWDEEPFEWVRPHRFGVRRWYRRGPIASFHVAAELHPEPAGGTRLSYLTAIRPRSWLGVIAVVAGMRLVIPRRFAAVFHRYDVAASSDHSPSWDLVPTSPVDFAPGGEDRLTALGQRLSDITGRPELAARITSAVAGTDDHAASHLRPYALADAWGAPRREILETCLHGARLGLLDLQWDLLCPLCRGAKASASKLAEMPRGVHCDACQIAFDASFDRSVEVTFRPNPAIRRIENHAYCVGGPQVTPHIVAQSLLAPGESRTLAPALETGSHRIRALGCPGGQSLLAEADGPSELRVVVAESGWPGDDRRICLTPTITFVNTSDAERLVVLERTAWNDRVATAAEVIALQTFRDLFAGEVLRPGEQIAAGSLTVLFTDLRDSTRLYRRIGDAVAFGRVLDHFAVLRDAVAAEDGAVVKTIGDAIMAVFPRPVCAVRAIFAAQRRLACPVPGGEPLSLKAGLHHGPCLAATLNDRLDYFGSTVNIAARLERFASGADVVVSDAVRHDPEIAKLLAGGQVVAEPFDAELKGFDDERFAVCRLRIVSADSPDLGR